MTRKQLVVALIAASLMPRNTITALKGKRFYLLMELG
jgi:hypothetical protein